MIVPILLSWNGLTYVICPAMLRRFPNWAPGLLGSTTVRVSLRVTSAFLTMTCRVTLGRPVRWTVLDIVPLLKRTVPETLVPVGLSSWLSMWFPLLCS